GWVQDVTDPRNLTTRTTYDLLGRRVQTVEAYSGDGTPTDNGNRTTAYTYDGGNHVLTQTARLPAGVTQTTQYVYGVTGAVINSNHLLAQVIWPANGRPNTEAYTYNALGEVVTRQDRNQTVHTYSRNVLGRLTSDVATLAGGSGVDDRVLRLDTAY